MGTFGSLGPFQSFLQGLCPLFSLHSQWTIQEGGSIIQSKDCARIPEAGAAAGVQFYFFLYSLLLQNYYLHNTIFYYQWYIISIKDVLQYFIKCYILQLPFYKITFSNLVSDEACSSKILFPVSSFIVLSPYVVDSSISGFRDTFDISHAILTYHNIDNVLFALLSQNTI